MRQEEIVVITSTLNRIKDSTTTDKRHKGTLNMRILLSLFLLSISSTVYSLKFMSFGVKGQLMCGSAPTPGIRIRLWDDDMGELVDAPDEKSFTDMEGKFEFDQWTMLNSEIEAVVRIAHDCNDGVKKGQRLFKFFIPKNYVHDEKSVDKENYFNLGVINLEMKPYNEGRYMKGDYGRRIKRLPRAHRVVRGTSNDEEGCMDAECSAHKISTKNMTQSWRESSPEERIDPW